MSKLNSITVVSVAGDLGDTPELFAMAPKTWAVRNIVPSAARVYTHKRVSGSGILSLHCIAALSTGIGALEQSDWYPSVISVKGIRGGGQLPGTESQENV